MAVIAYHGYLGLQNGTPQSVYDLDQRQIDIGALAPIGSATLSLGQSTTLTDGTTIRFDGYEDFAALQLSHDPAQMVVLASAIAMLLGLLGMLLVRQERVFVRIADDPAAPQSGRVPGSRVATAVLSRGGGSGGDRLTQVLAAAATADPHPRDARTSD